METLNAKQKQLTNQFEQALPKGAGKLAPRNGYFYIRSIEYQDIKILTSVPVAKVNWRPETNHDNTFVEDVIFKIALRNLPLQDTFVRNGDLSRLLGVIICIYDAGIIQEMHQGKQINKLSCKWFPSPTEARFTTSHALVLDSIFGETSTLPEANAAWAEKAPFDTTEADIMSVERENFDAPDATDGGESELGDAPDADTNDDNEQL